MRRPKPRPSAGSLQQQIERDQPDVQHLALAQHCGRATPEAPLVGQTVKDRACHFKPSMTRRICNNLNAITTDLNSGADQDGTLQRDRFWLTASVAF